MTLSTTELRDRIRELQHNFGWLSHSNRPSSKNQFTAAFEQLLIARQYRAIINTITCSPNSAPRNLTLKSIASDLSQTNFCFEKAFANCGANPSQALTANAIPAMIKAPASFGRAFVDFFSANPSDLYFFAQTTFPATLSFFMVESTLDIGLEIIKVIFQHDQSSIFVHFASAYFLTIPKYTDTIWSLYFDQVFKLNRDVTAVSCFPLLLNCIKTTAPMFTRQHRELFNLFSSDSILFAKIFIKDILLSTLSLQHINYHQIMLITQAMLNQILQFPNQPPLNLLRKAMITDKVTTNYIEELGGIVQAECLNYLALLSAYDVRVFLQVTLAVTMSDNEDLNWDNSNFSHSITKIPPAALEHPKYGPFRIYCIQKMNSCVPTLFPAQQIKLKFKENVFYLEEWKSLDSFCSKYNLSPLSFWEFPTILTEEIIPILEYEKLVHNQHNEQNYQKYVYIKIYQNCLAQQLSFEKLLSRLGMINYVNELFQDESSFIIDYFWLISTSPKIDCGVDISFDRVIADYGTQIGAMLRDKPNLEREIDYGLNLPPRHRIVFMSKILRKIEEMAKFRCGSGTGHNYDDFVMAALLGNTKIGNGQQLVEVLVSGLKSLNSHQEIWDRLIGVLARTLGAEYPELIESLIK